MQHSRAKQFPRRISPHPKEEEAIHYNYTALTLIITCITTTSRKAISTCNVCSSDQSIGPSQPASAPVGQAGDEMRSGCHEMKLHTYCTYNVYMYCNYVTKHSLDS